MTDLFPSGPSEEDLRKARRARGGAVVDAINIHGQDDFKRQERAAPAHKAVAHPYCKRHRTHFCPCVQPEHYAASEIENAMKEWDAEAKRHEEKRLKWSESQ